MHKEKGKFPSSKRRQIDDSWLQYFESKIHAVAFSQGFSLILNVLGAQPLLKGRVTPFFHGNKLLNKPNRQSKATGSAKKTILKN